MIKRSLINKIIMIVLDVMKNKNQINNFMLKVVLYYSIDIILIASIKNLKVI